MLVKSRILRGDYCVLQILRDFAQRNEFVVFAIRLVVHPGLYLALDVYRGRRRVDPPCGHQQQRGSRPKKHHAYRKPSN
jgi:hypothetical protein